MLILTGNKNSFPHLAITRFLEKIWGLQAHHQLECSKVVLVFEVKCHSFNIVVRIDLVSVSC